MKLAVIIASVSVSAMAMPAGTGPGDFKCPSGLYSQKQCCSTQVLGLLALDCESRS